jgi:hypothetical protein
MKIKKQRVTVANQKSGKACARALAALTAHEYAACDGCNIKSLRVDRTLDDKS